MSNTGKDMAFYPGFELKATKEPFGFQYGDVVIVPPGSCALSGTVGGLYAVVFEQTSP